MSAANVVRNEWTWGRPGFRPTVWNGAKAPAGVGGQGRPSPADAETEQIDRMDDIEFYQRLAFEAGDPVLVLSCGTGRLALPLARSGACVVGVEADAARFAVCRTRRDRLARAIKGRLDLVQGDLHARLPAVPYRLVLADEAALRDLTAPDERSSWLAAVVDRLADGGRLVVDLPRAGGGETAGAGAWSSLLAQHGLIVKERYGSHRGHPATEDGERLILVAKKC
jgi:SAM-dependent methyltransferase